MLEVRKREGGAIMDFPKFEELTDKQKYNIADFVMVSLYCDKEIQKGIDHQIPMTQELFDRTLAVLMDLGACRTLVEFMNEFGDEFGAVE